MRLDRSACRTQEYVLAALVRQVAPNVQFLFSTRVKQRIAPYINANMGRFRWSWHFAALRDELLTDFFFFPPDFRDLQTEN